jgi:hypothetical protein
MAETARLGERLRLKPGRHCPARPLVGLTDFQADDTAFQNIFMVSCITYSYAGEKRL